MKGMNKRFSFLLCLLVCGLLTIVWGPVSSAQDSAHPMIVKVRAARYQDYVRIVLTSDETLTRNASVSFTKNKTIRVDFKTDGAAAKERPVISYTTEKGSVPTDAPVEIIKAVNFSAKGGTCAITVPGAQDIKVFKLQSPPRVVVDALLTSSAKDPAAPGPAARPADQTGFKYIVIDVGHGGYDYGIKGAHFVEKDFNLAIARELAGMLSKSVKDTVLLRKSDQVMSLSERANLVNKRPPDIIISLHVSSSNVPVIYSVPATPEGAAAGSEASAGKAADQKKAETSKGIADGIAKSIEREFSVNVVRETIPLSLLVKSKAPAVIIELPTPDEFSYEKRNKERLLTAIIKGLSGRKEQPAPPAAPDNRPDAKSDGKTENKNGGKPERI